MTYELAIQRLPVHVSINPDSYTNWVTECLLIDAEFGEWKAVPSRAEKSAFKHPMRRTGSNKIKSFGDDFIDRPRGIEKLTADDVCKRLPPHIKLEISTYTSRTDKATFVDADFGPWVCRVDNVISRKGMHPKRRPKTPVIPIEEVNSRLPDGLRLIESTYTGFQKKCSIEDPIFGAFEAIPKSVALKKASHPKRSIMNILHLSSEQTDVLKLCGSYEKLRFLQ